MKKYLTIIIIFIITIFLFSCKKKTTTPKDTTVPTISLVGANPVNIQKDSTYIDAGATATDNIDGNITNKIIVINPVNIHVLGTYIVKYDVSDVAGNKAKEVTRTVIVVNAF